MEISIVSWFRILFFKILWFSGAIIASDQGGASIQIEGRVWSRPLHNKLNWRGAVGYCAQKKMRLPTMDELRALFNSGEKLENRKPPGSYWSANTIADAAESLEFSEGRRQIVPISSQNLVTCVSAKTQPASVAEVADALPEHGELIGQVFSIAGNTVHITGHGISRVTQGRKLMIATSSGDVVVTIGSIYHTKIVGTAPEISAKKIQKGNSVYLQP